MRRAAKRPGPAWGVTAGGPPPTTTWVPKWFGLYAVASRKRAARKWSCPSGAAALASPGARTRVARRARPSTAAVPAVPAAAQTTLAGEPSGSVECR